MEKRDTALSASVREGTSYLDLVSPVARGLCQAVCCASVVIVGIRPFNLIAREGDRGWKACSTGGWSRRFIMRWHWLCFGFWLNNNRLEFDYYTLWSCLADLPWEDYAKYKHNKKHKLVKLAFVSRRGGGGPHSPYYPNINLSPSLSFYSTGSCNESFVLRSPLGRRRAFLSPPIRCSQAAQTDTCPLLTERKCGVGTAKLTSVTPNRACSTSRGACEGDECLRLTFQSRYEQSSWQILKVPHRVHLASHWAEEGTSQ